MRRFVILLLLTGIILTAGCSSPSVVTGPTPRTAQVVVPMRSPALAFQLNAWYVVGYQFPDYNVPIDLPLWRLGMDSETALKIMSGASLVNATCAPQDVDVPEWDEWLIDVDVPEWDEWLIDVDVPEWDEWLRGFEGLPKYRSTDWMDWAVYGPIQIVDVDVPEWDEWLRNLTLGDMAISYDAWWRMKPVRNMHQ